MHSLPYFRERPHNANDATFFRKLFHEYLIHLVSKNPDGLQCATRIVSLDNMARPPPQIKNNQTAETQDVAIFVRFWKNLRFSAQLELMGACLTQVVTS